MANRTSGRLGGDWPFASVAEVMTSLNNPQSIHHVSVVTSAFNSQDFIEATYLSLKRQTHEDWEWLVVDDCSSDSTVSILEGLAKSDGRIRVILNRENRGAAYSRNQALKAVRGDFVAFLDADDLWTAEKLEKQLQFMQVAKADASFTGYSIIDRLGRPSGKTIDTTPRGIVDYGDALRKRATLGCSTVMLRKQSIGDALMPAIRTGQDYAFWLLLLRSGLFFHHLPEALSAYRIRPGSISRNKFKKAMRQWEIYRRIEKLSLSTSAISFAFYAIRAVLR
jgi:teichuronic acid biosynthesis glycosyltransferase TuaG